MTALDLKYVNTPEYILHSSKCADFFYMACRDGYLDTAKKLIKLGVDVNSIVNGQTPLFIACQQGNLEVVRELIQAGAKTDQPTKQGITPLYAAACLGHIEIVKELLKSFKNKEAINRADIYGATALYFAAKNGHLEVVKLLLNSLKDEKTINRPANDGATPLHVAAASGHLEVVKEFFKVIKDERILNQPTNDGVTPLQFAAQSGHLEIIKEFLNVLKDEKLINHPSKDGGTALLYACQLGHLEIVKELLKILKDEKIISQPAGENGVTALYLAVNNGHLEVVKELLKIIKDEKLINQPIKDGSTALHIACQNGDLNIVKEILKALKDKKIINLPDNDDDTPFHLAVYKGFTAIAEELIKDGADIDKPMTAGTQYLLKHAGDCKETLRELFAQEKIQDVLPAFTPLQAAIFFGRADMVELLLKNGATFATPAQGVSSYRLAVAMNKIDFLPPDLQQYHKLAKEQLMQEENDLSLLKFFDIKAGMNSINEKCLKLLTSSLQTQFEGIKEVTMKDDQLIIGFTSPELARGLNITLDNKTIKTNLENNFISLTGNHIAALIKFQQPNQPDNEGVTPLHLAALNGHLETVKEFIKILKDKKIISESTHAGVMPLHFAALNGHLEIVKELLNVLKDEKIIGQPTKKGSTAVLLAAKNGHLEVVKELLKILKDERIINQPDNDGRTPLHYAACNGHLEVVKELLKVLKDEKIINQTDNDGITTALHLAVLNGHLDVVKELLKTLKDNKFIIHQENPKKGSTAFHIACYKGHLEIVNELLKIVQDKKIINQTDDSEKTPFHLVVEKGFTAIAEVLLRNGADIEKPVKVNTELLLNNAGSCEEAFCELLAQEKIGDRIALTPLQRALFDGRADMVELLIKNGAKFTAPAQGISLYRLAVAMDKIDLLPHDLKEYHKLAKVKLAQDKMDLPLLKLFNVKMGLNSSNTKCLKLLTSSLQTQFEGIKEVTIKNDQLIIVLASPELAHNFNTTLNNTKIEASLENNCISITGKNIAQFIDFQQPNKSSQNPHGFFARTKKFAVPVGVGLAVGVAATAALMVARKR